MSINQYEIFSKIGKQNENKLTSWTEKKVKFKIPSETCERCRLQGLNITTKMSVLTYIIKKKGGGEKKKEEYF